MTRTTRTLLSVLLLAAAGGVQAQGKPIRAGVDATFPPHAFAKLSGGYQGFNVELGEEIAKRLGRSIEIEGAQYSALIPALNSGKYDFLLAPTTVSTDRAKTVLFTEGYLENNFTLIVKKTEERIKSLADLQGMNIAVNKGSGPEEWARANADKYGFKVYAFGTNADAVQAVASGRVNANLAGITPSAWAAKTNPQIKTTFEIKTGSVWAIPFRNDDVAARNEVGMVIKCMKKDGSLKALHEKWFGYTPQADSATVVSPPGQGAIGFHGYDATPVTLTCK